MPVENNEIARVFSDIADLLESRKDNIFKVRDYQKAAKYIEELTVEVEQLVREDRVREIAGVGEAIARKLTELVITGHLEYYDKLKTGSAEVAE